MQGHSNWKQLKRGPLEHEELLQEMFGGIVVDGSSACAPGEAFERTEEEGLAAEEQQGDDSETYASPHTSAYVSKRSLLNHGNGSSTSPLKKSKNQMVKLKDRKWRPEGGEWEPIKIPLRNVAYVPKSSRNYSLLTRSRPPSYRQAIGFLNWARNCNRDTKRC
jgi:hypothetical protein